MGTYLEHNFIAVCIYIHFSVMVVKRKIDLEERVFIFLDIQVVCETTLNETGCLFNLQYCTCRTEGVRRAAEL